MLKLVFGRQKYSTQAIESLFLLSGYLILIGTRPNVVDAAHNKLLAFWTLHHINSNYGFTFSHPCQFAVICLTVVCAPKHWTLK